MVTMTAVQEFADRVAEEFRPPRIVLFGSLADGQVTPDSDVDLLVVMPHDGQTWEAAARIRQRVPPPFPLDLLVRDPERYRQRILAGDVLSRDIEENGKVLHDARHA